MSISPVRSLKTCWLTRAQPESHARRMRWAVRPRRGLPVGDQAALGAQQLAGGE
jgi:hypothetical protein